MKYQVTVGNIGTVYDGDDLSEAIVSFAKYYHQSVACHGRAAGEEVTLWIDGEPEAIFNGDDPLYEVVFYGVEHAQHFQGIGVSYARWAHACLGVGEDAPSALGDALDNLASGEDGPALDLLVKLIETGRDFGWAKLNAEHESVRRHLEGFTDLQEDEDMPEDCELYYYVGLRYNTNLK
jgi:hypothetical protein